MTATSRETSISRERALAILTSLDMASEYDPQGDYYLYWDSLGNEFLQRQDDDEILAANTTTTSWAGSR